MIPSEFTVYVHQNHLELKKDHQFDHIKGFGRAEPVSAGVSCVLTNVIRLLFIIKLLRLAQQTEDTSFEQ